MNFREKELNFEDLIFNSYSDHIEVMDDEMDDAERLDRIEDAEESNLRGGHRHPNDFDRWPSNEQMEYYKRGGR